MTRTLVALALGVACVATTTAADWPQWRGPDRTGISKETGLLKEWPKDGPPLRWKAANIGTGYSTPVVVGGRVYLQTTDEAADTEFALALDEKTGKEVWKTPIGKVGKNVGPQYPGTRSTPTVDGDRLYCVASDGRLTCLGTDGKARWQKSYVKDFDGAVGTEKFGWAYSESVLVDGDLVIGTPGGEKAALVALNKMTGEPVWKTAIEGGDSADYSSVMPVGSGAAKQYVQFLRKGVVGVDAKTGKLLWRYAKTIEPRGANMMTPVVLGDRVFTSSSAGGSLVELKAPDGKASEVYMVPALKAGIGGAVLVDGHIYGAGEVLFCAEFATGKVKWSERGVGAAALCYADGRLYVRGQQGEIALVEPSPEAYKEVGRFKQPEKGPKPTWPYPIVANGGLYLRDWETLYCYEVKAGK